MREFHEPPTKTLMHILKDNNIAPAITPEVAERIKKQAELQAQQIREREEDCLKTIHTRYCIVKGIPINIKDVSRYQPDKRLKPNFWEYWLFWGTKYQTFLMSRDLKIIDDVPTLDIIFNAEVRREGE